MKLIRLAFIFVLAHGTVLAQTATSPDECHRRCTKLAFEEPEYTNDEFKEKLKKIQDRKKNISDPEKLKELEIIEKDEMEKLKESLDRTCRKICKY